MFEDFHPMMMIPCMVRFFCHIPGFMYGITGMDHYLFVKRNAGILLLPPLNPHGVLYESLSGPGGIALAVWNFLTFLPAFGLNGGYLFCLGLVDTIFVVLIATWLHFEKGFIGMTNAQCNQVPRNATTEGQLVFFERAWQTNVTSPDFGIVLCKSFMSNWYVGLVIAILYSISAFACFCGTGISGSDFWDIITFPIWAPYKLTLWAFHKLPDRIQNGIPYYTRYIQHWTIHKKDSSSGVKMHLLPSLLSSKRQESDSYAPKLAQILQKQKVAKYDNLQGIAQNVDYIDLVNLSLVSKAIRTIMFPSDEDGEEEDERQLRLNSCVGKIKSECWICAIQICQDCSATKFCRESTVSHHMKLCQSKCTNCFRLSLSGLGVSRQKCSCFDGRRPAEERTMYELARDGQERRLCRGCIVFADWELVAMRKRRDEAVYRSLAQQPLACSACKVVLPRVGPRWWVCSTCQLECGGNCHPRWWEWKDDV